MHGIGKKKRNAQGLETDKTGIFWRENLSQEEIESLKKLITDLESKE